MSAAPFDVTAPTAPTAGFTALPWRARVAALRGIEWQGISLRLAPYGPEHGDALRALRNRPEIMFNLAQSGALAAEQQEAWGRAYAARDNDLCWIIQTAAGEFAGATRLYDIDGDAGTAEKGGLVLREELARGLPLALEAEILLLQLAFAWLGLRQVFTQVRPENTKMISINTRLGFQPAGESELRGVPYLKSVLAAGGFDPSALLPILAHWKNRHGR